MHTPYMCLYVHTCMHTPVMYTALKATGLGQNPGTLDSHWLGRGEARERTREGRPGWRALHGKGVSGRKGLSEMQEEMAAK